MFSDLLNLIVQLLNLTVHRNRRRRVAPSRALTSVLLLFPLAPFGISSASAAEPAPRSSSVARVAAVVGGVREWLASRRPDSLVVDQWKFHPGDTPEASSVKFDDSTWTVKPLQFEWGPENSIAWYRRTVTIPLSVEGIPTAGHAVFLDLGVDDSAVAYVDGHEADQFPWDGGHILLSHRPSAGQSFLVAIKAINGPGTGRLFKAQLAFPDLHTPDEEARRYLESEDFILRAEELLPALAPSLRRREFAAVQGIVVSHLNGAAPHRLVQLFQRASEALSSPTIRSTTNHLVGYAHTDIDWLWQWADTKDVWYKNGSTMLRLMKEYPGFLYSQSQAVLYRAMQQDHPEFFKQMREAVQKRRWEPLNGWCESDMNMPSGESQIRQSMLGNNYYQKQFGVTSSVCWRPDSFGHAWTLPMILKGTGVDGYYFCRAGQGVPVFWWESPDGSRILAFNEPAWYNAEISSATPDFTIAQTKAAGENQWMTVYGVGDHGGGPTRASINEAIHLDSLPALPQLKFSSASDAFQALRKAEPRGGYPVLSGEMNPTFEGCYTSHVETKRSNRKLEHLLYSAEAWSSVASLMGRPYPAAPLREAWYETLRNQFHDILAGSNIHPSYEFAQQRYGVAERTADQASSSALDTLELSVNTELKEGAPLIVFNPLAWSRTEEVEADLSLPFNGASSLEAVDAAGNRSTVVLAPAENPGAAPTALTHLSFVARDVPAVGYRVYWLRPATAQTEAAAENTPGLMQNAAFRVTYDQQRSIITGIYDRVHRRELLRPGGAADQMQVLKEVGGSAWTIGAIQSTTPAEPSAPPELERFADGTQSLTLKHHYGGSELVHRLILRPGIPRVDFETSMNWQEKHTPDGGAFLKTSFDTGMAAPHAWWEIPFGAISRPAGGQESVGLKWVDVEETREDRVPQQPLMVPLEHYFNGDAFSSPANPRKGSFDQDGKSYPQSILPGTAATTVSGIPFRIPDSRVGLNQVIARGQVLSLPPNHGGDLYFLAAASNGSVQRNLSVQFAGGRTALYPLPVSDWVANGYAQTSAFVSPSRLDPMGTTPGEAHVWFIHVAVDRAEEIRFIRLPLDPHVHLFGLTLGTRIVSTPTFGVALLNDGRYGSDVLGSRMRLSLIRSSADPDPIFDIGKHSVRYSLYPYVGSWQNSDLVRQGWSFNTPLQLKLPSRHPGSLGPSGSFLSVSGAGIVCTAVKQSEDGADLVLRFYNASEKATHAMVTCSFPRPVREVVAADMKETAASPIALRGQEFTVPVGAWKSLTYRLRF